jgi:FAD/FMN-containing dehydrogenase
MPRLPALPGRPQNRSGWLGRRYGLAAHSITRAEVVLADGQLVSSSATEHPDLFWGLPGSAGNLGIVTELEFALVPVARVYGGNLYYPLTRSRDVLEFFAEWSLSLPHEVTAAVTFRSFPPLPTVPEPLRGTSMVGFRAVHSGDLGEARSLVDQARVALGPAVADTFAELPSAQLDTVSQDPVVRLGARTRAELLRDLNGPTIDALGAVAGPDARSPLAMLEVRLLGGALTGPSDALSPLAHTSARFSLNAIGLTTTPAPADAVRAHLARVTETLRPLATGDTYVNFLDLDQATPDRVRAAYSDADWTRLVALKAAYDPENLFRFTRPLS